MLYAGTAYWEYLAFVLASSRHLILPSYKRVGNGSHWIQPVPEYRAAEPLSGAGCLLQPMIFTESCMRTQKISVLQPCGGMMGGLLEPPG